MQCLIRTEPFSEAILKLDSSKSTRAKSTVVESTQAKPTRAKSTRTKSTSLIVGLKKTINEYTTKKTARVADIHEKLAETDTLFTVGKMSDSFFALCKIITLMTEEIKDINGLTPCKTSDGTPNSTSNETSSSTPDETPGKTHGKNLAENPADAFKHSLVNRSICYVMVSSMS